MFSFHAGELQGYRSAHNTEMDSVTRATQWSEVNSAAQLWKKKVNLVQIFSPLEKEKGYTKDQSVHLCCIINLVLASIPPV